MSVPKKIPVIQLAGLAGKRFLKNIKEKQQLREEEVTSSVKKVLDNIRLHGDKALFEYTKQFDKYDLSSRTVRVTSKEMQKQAAKISPELKEAICESSLRIENYHKKQLRSGFNLKTSEGTLSQMIKPLSRVGLYIPGGQTIYPSTVLMNAIPARVAGVREIVAVTPPRKELDPGIAFALVHLGIEEVYRIGGAQAIGALAYGTKTIRQVDKIVGPGNSYVANAKRMVYGIVDIDSIAGPSEVVILADTSVEPSWVALDLLAQAEHGTGDEIAICVTEDRSFAEEIARATVEEIEQSPVRDKFLSLPEHSISVIVCSSREESIAAVNDIAPEHLQIMTKDYKKDLDKIVNAAAIFLGKHTPVALGDYFIGTNHVLPTGGAARFSSPLGVDSFIKRISVAEISPKGLDFCAPYVSVFARAENFVHHALSVERRS